MGIGRQKVAMSRSRMGYVPILVLPLIAGVGLALLFAAPVKSWPWQGPAGIVTSATSSEPQLAADPREVLDTYCVSCHNERLLTAGLALDVADVTSPASNPEIWEKVVRRLRTGTMPPAGRQRPDAATYADVATYLETGLDRGWPANVNPGRIASVHRLNRREYNNAIRDLLGIDVNVQDLLPGDETADGSFDNLADALSFTTVHLERYMSVARQVTRLGVGLPPLGPSGAVTEIPLFIEQTAADGRLGDNPLGSRGGTSFVYQFAGDGQYEFRILLRKQYQDYIMGMGWPQQIDIRIDDKLMHRFSVGGEGPGTPAPAGGYVGNGTSFGDYDWEAYMHEADLALSARVPVQAGPHTIGVSFVRDLWEPESVPQPRQRGRVIADDEIYMGYAAILSIDVSGPFDMTGVNRDTQSRNAIFTCYPQREAEEQACATEILSRLAHRAYRRPVTQGEVQTLLGFFTTGRADGGSFDTGIQFALERLLVAPPFLLRVYEDPTGVGPGRPYALTDLQVASRLSFFLWATIPDERLLDLAERGQLRNPDVLAQEVRRMLADPRALDSLVYSFTEQWLNLQRVAEVVVDPIDYPQFDANLLDALRKETELFVASTITEDRSLLDLLTADYTYVNERLARHYGLPGVYGDRFRRVTLPDATRRGGLLAQGSILAVTSYPERTSPVLRGKWLINNMLGMPINPPENVDTTLPEPEQGARPLTIRERLDRHRTSPACNQCHGMLDPIGFALENYDVIGGYRDVDERGNPADTEGTMPNGTEINGFLGLQRFLATDQFVTTLTAKLMTYSVGRLIEETDRSTIRHIVQQAEPDNYRWSSIITGIVTSPQFLMRTTAVTAQ